MGILAGPGSALHVPRGLINDVVSLMNQHTRRSNVVRLYPGLIQEDPRLSQYSIRGHLIGPPLPPDRITVHDLLIHIHGLRANF